MKTDRTPARNDNHAKAVELGPEQRKYVLSIAMKYMKDEEAANDVAQDALLLAHRHRASFRGESRFSTWLYRVAATTALMHLRKSKRRGREILVPQRVSDDEPGPAEWQHTALGPSPEENLGHRRAIELIESGLDELGEKYRDIFWMRFLEGYTEPEIADRLGLKLTTVKTRTYRAKLAMRSRLVDALVTC